MIKMSCMDDFLFLNTPISSEETDIIGVGTHIRKLNVAIDSDAQMIAVTSPFGAGKTSVIELLQASREAKKKSRTFCEKIKPPRSAKEKVIKISMWSHLPAAGQEKAATDLHRTFIYHLASRIKPQRGSYIHRRLDPNCGMLGLYMSKMRYWFLTFVTLILALTSWMFKTFPEEINAFLPEKVVAHSDILGIGSFFLAVLFGLFVLTRADILFTFKNGEDGRNVDIDEIIDLYRTELLKPRLFEWEWLSKLFPGIHYVVVIEDLDRTANHKAAISFLTELRKYCAPSTQYKNRVTFVVNIKPEGNLNSESKSSDDDSLYAKIFDFVLNLQTINIDNYDSILEGLLQQRKEQISALGLSYDPNNIVNTLPGMQWIIREQRIGIREIKERLNIAFSLYESLRSKFGKRNNDIAIFMETCAAAAYLMTAFQKDFYSLQGREFDLLVDKYIEKPSADYHLCDEILERTSEEFRKTVWQLIDAKLIDTSYRCYFYNYPKNSKLYTTDESHVITAILYGKETPGLNDAVGRILETESTAIADAFHKIDQLNISLPDLIFDVELLYIETLRTFRRGLIRKLKSLDYSNDGSEKTFRLYLKALSYDKERRYYCQDDADLFCGIWESEFTETALLRWRRILCSKYPNEIIWYQSLFFGVHGLITREESDALALSDVVKVTNCKSNDFFVSNARYIQKRFSSEEEEIANFDNIKNFFINALEVLDVEYTAEVLLDFMLSAKQIIPEFEEKIVPLINDISISLDPEKLFEKYQMLVSLVAENEQLSEQTLAYISVIDRYDGYSKAVASQLYQRGDKLTYVLLSVAQEYSIPFEDELLEECIQENCFTIWNKYPEFFTKLRQSVVNTANVHLTKYSFLFGLNYPILTQNELAKISDRYMDSDNLIMTLIPQVLVEKSHVDTLARYFCRRLQNNKTAFAILNYISGFTSDVAKACFFALDFDKIRYRLLSAEYRGKIKSSFFSALKLSTPEGKMAFMEQTKFLDMQWETELADTMMDDSDLYERYIALVNQNSKIKNTTIQIICKLAKTMVYPMSPVVNEKLFESKKYLIYVLSKTAWENCFTMETGERGDILWPIYLQIFQDSDWKGIREHMAKNLEFVARIMREGSYIDFREDAMMQMCGVLQDQVCLQTVLESYGEKFALRYYMNIAGFYDRLAAETYLRLVKSTPILLASEELYNHTYEMLVDSILKAKYTRLRNRLLH